MRPFLIAELVLLLLTNSISHAVEIVIKTPGDEKKEEENKDEEQEVELPKRGQLNINAINTTDYAIVITARVEGLEPYTGMVAQGLISPNTPMTFASLFTAEPKAKFKFTQAEVFVIGAEHPQAINCNIKYPEPEKEEEKKPEPGPSVITIPVIPMNLEDIKKPPEAKEKGDDKKETSIDQAPKKPEPEPEPEPLNEMKESLDFYIYKPEGQAFPSCLIQLK